MTTQLDFWEYLGTFLETLDRLKKKKIVSEKSCKFALKTFAGAILLQNPDLIKIINSFELGDAVSTNEILAADLDGAPILIQDPQSAFNRYPSSEHYEEDKIPCYHKT